MLSSVWDYGQQNCTLMASGVDYLRLTASAQSSCVALGETFARIGNLLAGDGASVKPWGSQGYVGHTVGSLSFGERQDGVMLQASGSLAHLVFLRCPVGAVRCPRIDVQTTIVLPNDEETFHVKLLQATKTWQAANPKPKHPKLGTTGYEGEGGTFMVGHRTSERYGRVYDKHREKPEEYPLGAWRWELEAHDEWGTRYFEKLKNMSDDKTVYASAVREWFTMRGVPCPWSVGAAVAPEPYTRAPTDAEKQLRWLREMVAPTVRKLYEQGYGQEAHNALFDKLAELV